MQSPIELETMFQHLKPFCVDIAKNPLQYDHLDRLESSLLDSTADHPETWRCLFDYVVFPLRLCLKRAISLIDKENSRYEEKVERCLVKTFDIFRILVHRCNGHFNLPDAALSLISDSCLLIKNPPESGVIVGNRNLVSAVVDFTSSILATSDGAIKNVMIKNQPLLAQIVYALVQCLKRNSKKVESILTDDDEERHLQSNVLKCLSAILSLNDSICAAFLPAVASTLTELILTTATTNREEFISECLSVWTNIIFSAASVSTDSTDYTEEWRRNASLRLSDVYDRLSSVLISHHSSTLRRSFFDSTLKLLPLINVAGKSTSILLDCRKRSLEVIAACVADDQLDINLDSILELSRGYGDLLERTLVSTCWRLPRSSKAALSTQQRIDWRCLLGYVRLLGPERLAAFLLVDEQKECFFNGIIKSIGFGKVFVEIKPTEHVPDEEKDSTYGKSARRPIPLSTPSDRTAQSLVLMICKQLAALDDVNSIYEYLLRLCQRPNADRLQAMLILNCISNDRPSTSYVDVDILNSFVEHYLEALGRIQSLALVETCLILEGLGHCATMLGSNFQSTLISALYMIFSLLQFPQHTDHVWATLFDFATALDHRTVLEMILANMDYLSSASILRLRRLSMYPDSASVLSSMLDLLPWESIGSLRGTIVETLAAIDRFATYPKYRNLIASLLKVLERFCVAVASKAPLERQSSSSNDDDQKPPSPWFVELTVDILRKMRSWILMDGIPTRLAALRVLENGLRALEFEEDHLLPIIHQNWPSVLARLSDVLENGDDERLIVVSRSAFHVVVAMASASKSFVCRRIHDEAWPKVRLISQRYLPISKRANATVYSQSPSFRLQLDILQNLASVCKNIGAPNGLITEVEDLCEQYDKDILPALRNAGEACLSDLRALK